MNISPLTHLGDIPVEEFIRDYWQQKPLLIRQAFPGFESPVSGDELAGLALEEEVESRIVIENGSTPWELQRGPFPEEAFSTLPASPWTLLVQSLDHWVPEVAELLDYFRFIPNWRLDDIMASYAVDGGSVGPHFDQYDVFLVQATGQRHWQIGQKCAQSSPRLQGTELHILQDFDREQDWVLNPGDVLYLPPLLAHYGRAVGDNCMTLSVGFRAPSQAELLADFLEEQLSRLNEDLRYCDPGFRPTTTPGLIDNEAITKVQDLLQQAVTDRAQIQEWFGRYMTAPKSEYPLDCETIENLEIEDGTFLKNPQCRMAYSITEGSARLYVNGEDYECSEALARALCDASRVDSDSLKSLELASSSDREVIQLLLNNDILYQE